MSKTNFYLFYIAAVLYILITEMATQPLFYLLDMHPSGVISIDNLLFSSLIVNIISLFIVAYLINKIGAVLIRVQNISKDLILVQALHTTYEDEDEETEDEETEENEKCEEDKRTLYSLPSSACEEENDDDEDDDEPQQDASDFSKNIIPIETVAVKKEDFKRGNHDEESSSNSDTSKDESPMKPVALKEESEAPTTIAPIEPIKTISSL